MRVDETELVMALRHVDEQEGRIVRQGRLIGRLANIGAPLDGALDLLDLMNVLLVNRRGVRMPNGILSR
jgi:hypothetical protein